MAKGSREGSREMPAKKGTMDPLLEEIASLSTGPNRPAEQPISTEVASAIEGTEQPKTIPPELKEIFGDKVPTSALEMYKKLKNPAKRGSYLDTLRADKAEKEKKGIQKSAAQEGVPFMITRKMDKQLEDLGYSAENRQELTPQAAWDILKSGRRQNKSPARAKAEAPSSEPKKEIMLFPLDEIENIVREQLKGKAEITRLHITETATGLQLHAELDAGMMGGKISLDGMIVNSGNTIAVQGLEVDARGYVKSMIEKNLSGFDAAIKTYFEKQYGKQVMNIQIRESGLTVEFKPSSTASEAQAEDVVKPGFPPPEKKKDAGTEGDRTPQEWRAALAEMVVAHERSGSEDWKEKYFAKRSSELDREAQKLGLESIFRSLGEKYNNLSWKSKLAVGLGLGVGTALFSSASLPAAIACMSGIAIQRTAGMASMFLKFEKNSHTEKWGKEKAMGKAVLYTAGMTAGMLVLIAGVKEGIDFANQHNVGNATQELLKRYWPFGEVDVSPPKAPASHEAISPSASTETAEVPPSIAPAPDESALALEKAQAVTDKAFVDVKETLAEAQKLASEQQVTIDKTVDDYGNDAPQIGDETVPSNAEGLEELKAEVNADLTEHQELNDALNKIEADRFKAQLENPDFKADAELKADIQADLDKNVPEQPSVGVDASGGEHIEENAGTPGSGEVNPEAPFGRDANGYPFPSEQEAKDYDDLIQKGIRDPRETGAWPPESPQEKGFVEKLSDRFNNGDQDKSAEPSSAHFETNAAGLAVDTAHANAYLDAQGNQIIFGGSLEERAQKALELVAKDHSAVAYFDSTRPGGLFGWFQEHHLSKAYWPSSPEGVGAQQPVVVDDVTDATLRGVHLPSIEDLKEPYTPVTK